MLGVVLVREAELMSFPEYIVFGQMTLVLICLNLAQPVIHYLVKWCSLPYEDSTWELKQDIDQTKIEEFEKLMSREPETERVVRTGSRGRV